MAKRSTLYGNWRWLIFLDEIVSLKHCLAMTSDHLHSSRSLSYISLLAIVVAAAAAGWNIPCGVPLC
jgi:hypothetical protein